MSAPAHVGVPADLGAERIAEALGAEGSGTRRWGRSLEVRAVTASTNDDARAAADAGCPDGHVVVADQQRAGRGSGGRRWDSPAGVDLYFSVVCRLGLPPSRLPPLTLAVGLGALRALEPRVASPLALKWPNDLLLDGRKCAGVLVETVSLGARVDAAVVGVGVGVNRARFAPPLDASATSLRRATGRAHPRAEVLAQLLGEIEREVDRFVARGPTVTAAQVDARLAWRGETVEIGATRGTLLGVAPSGALRLRTEAGERTVSTGRLRRVEHDP